MGSQVCGPADQDWATLQKWLSGDSKYAFLSIDRDGRIVGKEKLSGFKGLVERVISFFGSSTLEKVARQIVLIQGEQPVTEDQKKVVYKINEKIISFNKRSRFRHPRRISTTLFDSLLSPEKFVERKRDLLKMIKEKLSLDHLIMCTDVALSDKIKASVSNRPIATIFVNSLATHTFPGTTEPKPAKLIILQLRDRSILQLWGTGVETRSADSLFAAARAIFGSKNKTDQQELANIHGRLFLYVEENFLDIDIKTSSQKVI